MQRTIATYLTNRVKDEIFAKPNQETESEQGQEQQVEATAEVVHDPLDGELIRDDDGNPLGRATRMQDISVYVVAPRSASAEREFQRGLEDPDTEVIWHQEDGRITALIYVPTQGSLAGETEGFRPDDV